VRVAVRQSGHWAVVEVEDTGPGVPEAMRDTIFERFRQLEGGGDRRFGGTGLGLSIVKQFVDLHGGTVTVEAGPDAIGSVFRVELPVDAPEGAIVQRVARQTDEELVRQALAGMGKQKTSEKGDGPGPGAPLVLLVEDNPDMNQFLKDTLSASYRVRSAFDGQDGLQKALEMPPDLILCDVMMPRMTGDRLVREIRRRQEFDDVPIVLLTAKADDELRVRLLKEGAQDFLHKPFDTRAVLAKVERLLADRRRRQQAEEALHRLSAGLVQEQDRERRQLAVELNEHIAQCLAALGMYLQMAQTSGSSPDAAGRNEIAQSMALLERCLTDVRGLSQTLHPMVLDHLGLPAAMEWHIQSFSSVSGIPVALHAASDFGRLPDEGELALFRVLQDALERVRQAGSKHVEVRAFRDVEEAGLEVTVEKGTFRPVDETDEDLGMAATRERVRKMGGRLEVTGSAIRAVLPAPQMNP
jgi:DNA-binding response OmpR family regulator